jgi:serine/threonine protein kinase
VLGGAVIRRAVGAVGSESCLSEEEILAFVGGTLTRPQIKHVDRHLGDCAVCNMMLLEALRSCPGQAQASADLTRRCFAFEAGMRVADRYVIRRALGQGGMGDVYEARDLQLEEWVAIKTVVAAGCDNPEATRRLKSEVKLARRVVHPNVCRVHDLGVHEDSRPRGAQLSFISMELIDGEVLTSRLSRGSLDPVAVRALARELLLGLSAIHRAGVIHRDIKSHNVMLRSDARQPRVAIIDFGLAIESDPAGSLEAAAAAGGTGLAFEGSPRYMAPEQFRSLPLMPAADVFACGVVLFEALTGSLPFRSFRANGDAAGRRAPDEVPLRARDVAHDVPAPLDEFIAQCLTPDPCQRFADAGRALDGLDQQLC